MGDRNLVVIWSEAKPVSCPHLVIHPVTMTTTHAVRPREQPTEDPAANDPGTAQTADSEEEEDPLQMSPAQLIALRANVKRNHTKLLKRIEAHLALRGSRRELIRLGADLVSLYNEALRFNNAYLQVASDLSGARRQVTVAWGKDLEQVTNEVQNEITAHIESRQDEAASNVSTTSSMRSAREKERLLREKELEIEARKNEIEHKRRLLELERETNKLD